MRPSRCSGQNERALKLPAPAALVLRYSYLKMAAETILKDVFRRVIDRKIRLRIGKHTRNDAVLGRGSLEK
jgi:hypothetical protein